MAKRDKIADSLREKLDPRRVQLFRPVVHAVFACMLRRRWVQPELSAFIITSDGYVLGQRAGDVGYNDFLGLTRAELEEAIASLVARGILSPAEAVWLKVRLPRAAVGP